jgi:hypothetical protein
VVLVVSVVAVAVVDELEVVFKFVVLVITVAVLVELVAVM